MQTLFVEPGCPWENGPIGSLDGRPGDELLNREIFYRLGETQVFAAMWHAHYNYVRPHSALGYRPPAPLATMSVLTGAQKQELTSGLTS